MEEKEFERNARIAHELYSKVIFEHSGLKALPKENSSWGHFVVPLPNDWYLELTSPGMDSDLMPPGSEEGDGCIFWLISPRGLYAAEEDVYFDAADDEMADAIAAFVCRRLWRHFDKIVGTDAAKKLRKGLPRPHALKIKALVERGDFEQPPMPVKDSGERNE